MKNKKLYSINLKEMRENARAILTARAQMVAEGVTEYISSNLVEAYSDNPFSTTDKIPYYSRDNVKAILQKVETPNKNDDNYEDNYNNSVHRSEEGVDKLKNSETNKDNVESGGGKNIEVEDGKYDRENAVRLMKDLYFRESEENSVKYIDYSDDSTDDEDEFRNALINAQSLHEVIVISLDDGNELDLDIETINKLLANQELFKRALQSFESISSITAALGVDLPEDDGTHDAQGYMEERENPEVLVDQKYFTESIFDYLESQAPEAILIMNEEMFAESPKDFVTLSESLNEENNPNRIERGRAVMVNRVRGGQLQLRKLVSNAKGYKIVAGSAVRMKPAEIKKRRISAKFASKKRRNMQSRINRQTKLSLRFRARRLDN